MKIERLDIHEVCLPFASSFSHALRKRSFVVNIVVEVVTKKGGIHGYGESAPRSYVTGESPASVRQDITRFLEDSSFPWDLDDASQIWRWVDAVGTHKSHHAAVCAVEMALLDALGKEQHRFLSDFFPKHFFTPKINYGAAFPLDGEEKIRKICRLVQMMQINRLKLKLGEDLNTNRAILETVRDVMGVQADIKVDINGVWGRDATRAHLGLMHEFGVKIVEQPLPPADPEIPDVAALLRQNGILLMADESVCSLADAKATLEAGHYNMVNVRLSKCGGFHNSLGLIDYLRKTDTPFQIGCHLGESGLLSAAGRTLSLLCSDAMYHDGSYDEFLLKDNLTHTPVSFGLKGEAGALEMPGLGVAVDPESLKRLSDETAKLSISKP